MKINLQKPTQEQVDAYKNRVRPKKAVKPDPTLPPDPNAPKPVRPDCLISPSGKEIRYDDCWSLIREASEVLKARWPEAEPFILKNDYYGTEYAKDVIKGPWPELEQKILEKGDLSNTAMSYAQLIMKRRWTELEDIFLANCKDSEKLYGSCVHYTTSVIKERWPELEELIIEYKSVQVAMNYAQSVIKGRWTDMEPMMIEASDKYALQSYAINTIKGRWTAAEPEILKNNYATENYVRALQRMNIAPPPSSIMECENAILGIISLRTGDYAEIYDPTDPDIVILFGEGKKPYVTDGTNIFTLKGVFVKPCNAACTMKINRFIDGPKEKK